MMYTLLELGSGDLAGTTHQSSLEPLESEYRSTVFASAVAQALGQQGII